MDASSVALPAISTGVYGYPVDLASRVSLSTIRDFLLDARQPELVRMVLFSAGALGPSPRRWKK